MSKITPNTLLITIAALTLIVMQGWIFSGSYRTTADDIYFHNLLLNKQTDLYLIAHQFATTQGRLGQYISVPLVIYGSFFADSYWIRIVYVGLYFLLCYLTASYFSKILNAKIGFFIFILAISFLSLGPETYNHLPPNAYPLLITLPCLLIVLLKQWEFALISEGKFTSFLHLFAYSLVMIFSLLINEYAFLFGSGLYMIQLIGLSAKKITYFKAYLIDLILLALGAGIYFLFRSNFPSTYDGNSPAGIKNLLPLAYTTIAHIFSGSSIPVMLGWATETLTASNTKEVFLTSSFAQKFASLAFGLASACLSVLLLNQKVTIKHMRAAMAASIAFMVYVSLPTSATLKYQLWCNGAHCAYIDSRISYLGLIFLISLLLISLRNFKYSNINIYLIAAIVFFLASFNYLNNQLIRDKLADYSEAWTRAQNLICEKKGVLTADESYMTLIDPKNNIKYHVNFDINAYWLRYMNYFYTNDGCK